MRVAIRYLINSRWQPALILAGMSLLVARGAVQTDSEKLALDRDHRRHLIERHQWLVHQRSYPFEKTPLGARLRAWRQRQDMERSLARSSLPLAGAPAVPVWKSIGPQPTSFWDGNSSGRITALAVDPRNSQAVWAGAADGGVWKTTNGGVSWTPMTDAQPSLSTGAIALDPTHPDTVYVGTGESNFSGDEFGGIGLLKSTDAGATWTNYPGLFAGRGIAQLAIQPSHTQVLLAAGGGGVYRSPDGGANWTNVLKGNGSAVVFDSTGAVAWAGIGDPWGSSSNGVFKSTDAGSTWQAVTGTGINTLPSPADTGRVSIAVAPSNPSTILVSIGSFSSGSGGAPGVFQSTDAGSNWTLVSKAGFGGSWYCNPIAISPANTSLVLGGGSDINLSSDGGRTWTPYAPPKLGIHPDQHAIAFSSDGSVVYIGNDGGVRSTTDIANLKAAWNELSGTLSITQFYPGMSLSPSNLNFAVAGTQDNGTLLYSGSLDWAWLACGDGGTTAVDPVNPLNLYVACTGGTVSKSVDGGKTMHDAGIVAPAAEGAPFSPGLAIDPANSLVVYFTGIKRIYQSRDGAATWQPITEDLPNAPSVIAVAPSDSNAVMVGRAGSLMSTANALAGPGSTWVNHSAGLPVRMITAIVISPVNPLAAWVTLSGTRSGHVYSTVDGGATWVNITGNLPDAPVSDLALDPDLEGTIYVAADVGVFVSENGGASWSPLGAGLPNSVATGVRFHAATRTLRVSTHGRGMWDLALPLQPLQLSPGGLVNAASYGIAAGSDMAAHAVSPGSIATLFGSGLTNVKAASASSLPLPRQLAGESLLIGALSVPQFYAARNQINIQIPWETPLGNGTAVLSIGSNTATSAIQVVEYLPGIFTATGSGSGQGIIVHPGSAALAAPAGAYGASHPAAKGEVLTLYATGLGPVDHTPPTGAASLSVPLAQTTSLPMLTVGGVQAPVSFSGLTPGLVGLYQVNFSVPENASAGNNIPVVLTIGGVASNQVTLSVAIPSVEEPPEGFPRNARNALAVPFPVLLSGTLPMNAASNFKISLSQQTNVHFELTGSGGFKGWLFLLNQDWTWKSYIYTAAPDTGTMDALLDPGDWTFQIAWNSPSAVGPYQLLVESR